jgi:hypothetical protein
MQKEVVWFHTDGVTTNRSRNRKVTDRWLCWVESPINSTYDRRRTRSGLDGLDANQVAYRRLHWIEGTENERRIRTGLTANLRRMPNTERLTNKVADGWAHRVEKA